MSPIWCNEFNGSCTYPNSLPIRSYFMDEHAHNAYGPYLNKYVTSQLESRAQRTAVAQCHLGTKAREKKMLQKGRITKFRGPW